MGNWTLETIAWDRFDASKVDPEILRNIKAAALVERNAEDYGVYLGRVFADDAAFMESVNGWVDGRDPARHGAGTLGATRRSGLGFRCRLRPLPRRLQGAARGQRNRCAAARPAR